MIIALRDHCPFRNIGNSSGPPLRSGCKNLKLRSEQGGWSSAQHH
jgi:hypothetical protein